MQFHQLRYFVSAVEKGGMSQAAKHCFISQPSMSQQIKRLEETTGVDLFIRRKGKLILTEEGKILYSDAKKILASVGLAKKNIRDYLLKKPYDISIGILPTISPYIANDILTRVSNTHQTLKVNLQESYSDELINACLCHELDYIITAGLTEHRDLKIHHLLNDPFCVVLREDHSLANKAEIDLTELQGEPFVLIKSMHCIHAQISEIFRVAEFSPKIKFETSHIETIQRLIFDGHGISILPDISKRIVKLGLRYIPIINQPYREISLAYRKNFSHVEMPEDFINAMNCMS